MDITLSEITPTALQNEVCVLILGCGAIGRSLLLALRSAPSCASLVNIADPHVAEAYPADVLADPELIRNYDYVINTIPVHDPEKLVPLLVACIKHGVHYLDTNEDREIGRFVKMIGSRQTDVLFAPHCGLAPGMINVMGAEMLRTTGAQELDLRVGALTNLVDNEYLYTPTWSPIGMVNQALNEFEVIESYKKQTYSSVFSRDAEGRSFGHFQKFYHHFYIDGIHYECFPTSGGLGTMSDLADLGHVKSLMYRTIRLYKHAEALRTLFHAYGFDRSAIVKILEEHRLNQSDDFVFMIARTNGSAGYHRHVWMLRAESGDYRGNPMTAIQKCTVAGVAAIIDLHVRNKIKSRFLHQHEVDWNDYSSSPYVRAINFRSERYGAI